MAYVPRFRPKMSDLDKYPTYRGVRHHRFHCNGAQIRKNIYTYSAVSTANIQQLTLSATSDTEFDLDGTLIRSTDTTFNNYDIYGNAGTTVTKTSNGPSSYRSEKLITYKPDPASWQIAIVQEVNETRINEIDGDRITLSTLYQVTPQGKIEKRTDQRDDQQRCVITAYTFDAYGNPTSETKSSCQDLSVSRTSKTTTYGYAGTLIERTENVLGHTETYQYDNIGHLTGIMHANGVQDGWAFNSLDQPVKTTKSGLADTIISYNWYNSCDQCVYAMQRQEAGKATETTVYDSLQRERRAIVQSADGHEIYRDTVYDNRGHVIKKSLPYVAGTATVYWSDTEYDLKGRQIKLSHPVNETASSVTRTMYSGSKITFMDALNRQTIKVVDVSGNPVQVTDATGGVVAYEYDANGKLKAITDPAGSKIKFTYDNLGNRVRSEDPNMGTWNYEYNVFGDLVNQTDAKGQTMLLSYDQLGRLKQRTEPEGLTIWTYDVAEHGVGAVASVSGPNVSHTYQYNQFGQVVSEEVTVGDEQYIFGRTYDQNNRVTSQTLPGGATYNYLYDAVGLLQSVCTQTDKCHWRATSYDADQKLLSQMQGNGVSTDIQYNLAGQVVAMSSKDTSSTEFRFLSFAYDLAGRLTSRTDNVINAREDFSYDLLDRIVSANVNTGGKAFTEMWTYDVVGNIVRYSGFSEEYKYHAEKPHAVINAGPHSFQYDANGNVIQKDNYQISWSSFNKMSSMWLSDGERATFLYDVDRNKLSTTFNDGSRIVEIGPMFRRETDGNGNSNDVHTIYALGKPVAVLRFFNASFYTEQYIHLDHMGSVDTITNSTASVLARYSYNAFGKARTADWQPAEDPVACNPPNYLPGFTGQRFLDAVGFLDMNGRVYDPSVSRFLSPDPLIANLLDAQTLNRYAYAANSPFKYKDPSGYFFALLLGLFSIVGLVQSVIALGPIGLLAGAMAMSTKYFAGLAFANMFSAMGLAGSALTILTSVFSGAAASFVGALITTEGNLELSGKAALSGAVMGIVEGISGTYKYEPELGRFHYSRNSEFPPWLRVATESTAGGLSSVIMGGRFVDGFTLSLKSSIANEAYDYFVKYDFDYGPGGAAVPKNAMTPPHAFANNFGTSEDGSWVEGGKLSQIFNRVPTLNAVAGAHDQLLVVLAKFLGGGNPLASAERIKDDFNKYTMPIALLFTEYAGSSGAVSVPFIAKHIAEHEQPALLTKFNVILSNDTETALKTCKPADTQNSTDTVPMEFLRFDKQQSKPCSTGTIGSIIRDLTLLSKLCL